MKIQKIIYDEDNNLFIRKKYKGEIYSILSFDTYFNMFSYGTWHKYTSIDNLYLDLTFRGKCDIFFYGIDCHNVSIFLKYEKFNFKYEKTTSIEIPLTKYPAIYFVLKKYKNFEFKEGWYETYNNIKKIFFWI